MREVTIENTVFKVRSLRRAEIREHNLKEYGYLLRGYEPPTLPAGDDGNKAVDWDKAAEGQIKVLDLVIDGGTAAVDRVGGHAGVNRAWWAVIAETYSLPGEEKNSSPSGPPAQTRTE